MTAQLYKTQLKRKTTMKAELARERAIFENQKHGACNNEVGELFLG